MFKIVSPEQLRLGMYIQRLIGTWLARPQWSQSFMLSKMEDLNSLRVSKSLKIVIDTSRHIYADGKDWEHIDHSLPAYVSMKDRLTAPRAPASHRCEHAENIILCGCDAVAAIFDSARLRKPIDLQEVFPVVDDITRSIQGDAATLIALTQLKRHNDDIYRHSVAVCTLMVTLAHHLKLSDQDIRDAGIAGLLHDAGKVFIPEEILSKPGSLTREEFAIVQQHPAAAVEILRGSGVSDAVLDVCMQHHEKIDGTGYPAGLQRSQLSLLSKMAAVCDVYDALTSQRAYKDAWEPEQALSHMNALRNFHFDAQVVQDFTTMMSHYLH